jgi:hypothetical protein
LASHTLLLEVLLGIENATAIHVPLTRRHSLAMYLPSAVPPQLAALERDIRWPGVTATALYNNSCTVNSARRFLFHHPDVCSPTAYGNLDGETVTDPAAGTAEVNACTLRWNRFGQGAVTAGPQPGHFTLTRRTPADPVTWSTVHGPAEPGGSTVNADSLAAHQLRWK